MDKRAMHSFDSISISEFDKKKHNSTNFDCGTAALNNFLSQNASQYERIGASKTFVITDGDEVYGFYSVSMSAVEPKIIDIRWPKHTLPVLLVGRLAVDKSMQGKGFGRLLVADIFNKANNVAKIVGCTGVVVDAKDESAMKFYEQCAFKSSRENKFKMFIPMKNIAHFCRKK